MGGYGDKPYGDSPYKDEDTFTSDFVGTPLTGSCSLGVQFTDLTVWYDSDVIGWLWDFGDGTTSEEQNPTHQYRYPGIFSVSMTIFFTPYGGDPAIGQEQADLSYKTTKHNYVVVAAPPNAILESLSLRMATDDSEGQGWAECSGNSFVLPVEFGAYTIFDDNDVERCIIEDEGGDIYEQDTYDRVIFLAPCFIDKADVDGTKDFFSAEIATEKWGPEETAGGGQEENRILDEKTWMQIRPTDADNRSRLGYTGTGLRNLQLFGLDVYADGEKITPSAQAMKIPEVAEIVFTGVRVEARRIQYVHKSDTSEFRIVEIKHKILSKECTGTLAEKETSEYVSQLILMDKIFLHVSRGSVLDRVSWLPMIVAPGVILSQVNGPDNYENSAFQSTGEMILPNSTGVDGNYSLVIFAGAGVGQGSLNLKSVGGVGFFDMNIVGSTTVGTIPYSLMVGTYQGVLPAALRLFSTVYPMRFFDIRILQTYLYNSDQSVLDFFNDMKRNNGNAFLPSYI